MDATVDDFLKEINEIAPPNETKPHPKSFWKECFDESSGFAYYWNTQTDEVTWEMPDEYKMHKQQNSKSILAKTKMFVPPKSEVLFPAVKKDTVKIYKLNDYNEEKTVPKKNFKTNEDVRTNRKRSSSESDDEKIVLISSYGGETESESDAEQPQTQDSKELVKKQSVIEGPLLPQKSVPQTISNSDVNDEDVDADDDDDTDLLTQIQNRVKVLKELGGELPEDVKILVNENSNLEGTNFNKKNVTGFSLVAGYGEDSDEEDGGTKIAQPENNISHSSLFPITPSIDVKQFEPKLTEKLVNVDDSMDVKAFQRKRRIGVDLVNSHSQKKRANSPSELDSERAGFGFKPTNVEYVGFKSAGLMFVKSDVLNTPAPMEQNGVDEKELNDINHVKDDKIIKEIENIQTSLGEKLKFLSEGHNAALPVQVMIIQMETLYAAMKANSLKPSYLKAWLKENCEELIKLEKDAAPNGWLLQWDRIHKRYYYYNQSTGGSQWEYPQSDVVRSDDAMDICTTPPPPSEELSNDSMNMNILVPPPPPCIKEKSVSPPPPPVISDYKTKTGKDKNNEVDEPLPPGVDAPEVTKFEGNSNNVTVKNDDLSSALNSFYSDLAAIETPAIKPEQTSKTENTTAPVVDEKSITLQTTKKKKTKVKIAQGLAMKKKGVSKLVEKWKNVQKNYD